MQDRELEGAVCPPHHWMIEDDQSVTSPRRVSRCVRCGEQREEALSSVSMPNRKYRSMSSWSREEFILADLPLD